MRALCVVMWVVDENTGSVPNFLPGILDGIILYTVPGIPPGAKNNNSTIQQFNKKKVLPLKSRNFREADKRIVSTGGWLSLRALCEAVLVVNRQLADNGAASER